MGTGYSLRVAATNWTETPNCVIHWIQKVNWVLLMNTSLAIVYKDSWERDTHLQKTKLSTTSAISSHSMFRKNIMNGWEKKKRMLVYIEITSAGVFKTRR